MTKGKPFRIAYFGTPDYSARFLGKLIQWINSPPNRSLDVDIELTSDIELAGVITQPDRPTGRKQILTPSPVKEMACKHEIQVFDTIDVEFLKKVDLAIVFGYGHILKQEHLDSTKYGFWNVHLSLLPAFRGASPTVYPLILGKKTTGWTLMHMDSQLDHGSIIEQEMYTVKQNQTNAELIHELSDMTFAALIRELERVITYLSYKSETSDTLKPSPSDPTALYSPQDHSLATFTRSLTRQDGYVELELIRKALSGDRSTPEQLIPQVIQDYFAKNRSTLRSDDIQSILDMSPAEIVHNMWRGLHPWPGIWTIANEKRLKLIEMRLVHSNQKMSSRTTEQETPPHITRSRLEITTSQLESRTPGPFDPAQLNV